MMMPNDLHCVVINDIAIVIFIPTWFVVEFICNFLLLLCSCCGSDVGTFYH